MVLMALDHTRDFLTLQTLDPTDLAKTWPALFWTRWITHFCAPVFVFLAGASAYLAGARGKTVGELAGFLVKRGLWLILLELTVVRFAWTFNLDFRFTFGLVLWAIGWSLIVLAGLLRLGPKMIAAIGLVIICGHNLLDGVRLTSLLHEQQMLQPAPGYWFLSAYPVLPWIGVMCAGFGFGALYRLEVERRRRLFGRIGLAAVAAFLLIRGINMYGDPSHWAVQRNALYTVMSFVNTTKYGPSLLYTLMTLGPAILSLTWMKDGIPRILKPLAVFGRVPLFYYLLHFYLLHAIALVIAYATIGRAGWLFANPPLPGLPKVLPPAEWNHSLLFVYAIWAVAVLLLYPACVWFAKYKGSSPAAALKYF